MKRLTMFLILSSLAPTAAFADVCTDIRNSYTTLISGKQQEANAAVSLTTDPSEKQAILAMFEMQKAQLEAERDSLLAANGCLETTVPNPSPVPNPDPSPVTNPDPSPSPVTNPDPQPSPTPGPIGGGDDDGGPVGGGNEGCAAAYEQARMMRAQGDSIGNIHHFLHGCGCNAGQWQAGKAPKELGGGQKKLHR